MYCSRLTQLFMNNFSSLFIFRQKDTLINQCTPHARCNLKGQRYLNMSSPMLTTCLINYWFSWFSVFVHRGVVSSANSVFKHISKFVTLNDKYYNGISFKSCEKIFYCHKGAFCCLSVIHFHENMFIGLKTET